MNILNFLITVGEDITFKTLDSIRENGNGGKLIVWYHPIKSHDLDYFNRLLRYTDDVILCTKNRGSSAAFQFLSIMEDYDYIISACADSVMMPNYTDKLMKPFKEVKRLGMAGGIDLDFYPTSFPDCGYLVNDINRLPDISNMVSKEIVNEIGGHLTAFSKYGFENLEWMCRAIRKSWSIATCKDIFIHSGTKHAGRETMPDLDEQMEANKIIFNKAKQKHFMGYNWWSKTI